MTYGGRHRQLSTWQKILYRTGSALLILATLGVGNLVMAYTPDVNTRERPFLRSGEPGNEIDVRRFTVTVLATEVAAVIKAAGWEHDTQGKWIVLRVRLEAVGEPLAVRYAALWDDQGRSYEASDRLQQRLVDGSRRLQPGIPVEGDVAFEVPAGATGLTARFTSSDISQRMDAMSAISLPLPDTATWLDPAPKAIKPIEVNP